MSQKTQLTHSTLCKLLPASSVDRQPAQSGVSSSEGQAAPLPSRQCPVAARRKPILASIIKNPEEFIEDGGWDFLDAEGGSDAEGDDGTALSSLPATDPCTVFTYPCQLPPPLLMSWARLLLLRVLALQVASHKYPREHFLSHSSRL